MSMWVKAVGGGAQSFGTSSRVRAAWLLLFSQGRKEGRQPKTQCVLAAPPPRTWMSRRGAHAVHTCRLPWWQRPLACTRGHMMHTQGHRQAQAGFTPTSRKIFSVGLVMRSLGLGPAAAAAPPLGAAAGAPSAGTRKRMAPSPERWLMSFRTFFSLLKPWVGSHGQG